MQFTECLKAVFRENSREKPTQRNVASLYISRLRYQKLSSKAWKKDIDWGVSPTLIALIWLGNTRTFRNQTYYIKFFKRGLDTLCYM